jgi:hypothetical protein
MRAFVRTWIVTGVAWGVAGAGVALAAPKAGAGEKFERATQLDDNGDTDKALAVIDEGLAIAPKDLRLLSLKGTVLLKLRDYPGALATYQAYLDAGATGANRREAQKIVNNLRATQSTFLDITLANGPAAIYLDSKTQGLLCTAAPSCNKAMLPGDYKVIAERPGFDRWTGRVTIERGKTAKLALTLVEKPSLLTVRVAQPGAHVTVDDKSFDAPTSVAAGNHTIAVSLPGHAEARLEAAAHEGKPVDLDITLTPLVPIRVEPSGATLVLDDKPVAIQDGGIAVPSGAHALVARAQGFRDRRIEIPAERTADYQLAIELAPVVAVTPPGPSGRFTPRRKVALAVAGAGVVAAAAGTVLGLSSRQLDHDTYALCPSPSTPCTRALEANDLNRRGQSRALQANLAFGVAGAAAVATAILWLTGAPESRVAVAPRLGAVAGLDLAVRF